MMRQLFAIFAFLQAFPYATSSQYPFLGVNYGQVADNLPPPSVTSQLLQSTTISKVRLYNADPAVIQSLAGTNISIVVSTSNSDIASLSNSPSFASQWISANILPFVPRSSISIISVGNEVLNSGDPSLYSQILPAMQNLQNALPPGTGIRISTVHSMAVMSQSDPPSSGAFHVDLAPFLNPILGFLSQNGGPFMINPYPYFAYRDDPRPETLAYCLFQPNLGRMDLNTNITYMNMFDAQVDAIKSALNSAGFGNLEIVVAETGWPYKGDDGEVGATIENAKAYNGNLVKHLKTMVGTPLMPGKSVDTYIFALYDEDLKPGPTSERSFGMYRTDSTMIYDADLSKSSSTQELRGGGVGTRSEPLQWGLSTSVVDHAPKVNPSVIPPGNPLPPTPMVTPAQIQPAIDCRLIQSRPDCNTPRSLGSHTVDLVYHISATLALNQLFKSIFCHTFSFSLSFMFHVSLPLLFLS